MNLFPRPPVPWQVPAGLFLPISVKISACVSAAIVSVFEQMPNASTERVREVAARLKRTERTIWRWAAQGCDLTNQTSIRQFAEGKRLRKTNIQKAREKLEAALTFNDGSPASGQAQFENLFSG